MVDWLNTERHPMKITVFGSGYVGLVTGACLADAGHNVLCIDVDENKIELLKKGQIPIFEPGLDILVKNNFEAGRLAFSSDASIGVAHGLLQFIAVGTPPDEDGSADLKYVLAVARSIGRQMEGYRVIINKSTVPVGTADRVQAAVREELAARNRTDIDFDVCSNPEFLKEGAAIEDFTRGARIVIGTDSERVRELMHECYAPYNRNRDKLIAMDVRSAELTKYAANAMLATKISFMNEIAALAELLGADVENVRHGIGSDPRIGYHFIYPGCGYGGSCFPKDVQALQRTAASIGRATPLLEAVETVNNRQKEVLFEKVCRYFDGVGALSGKTFGIWGLAFKPNTDDMREAPSRVVIDRLLAAGARVRAYDPEAMHETSRIYQGVERFELCETKEDAAAAVDALIICTEWKSFRAPDFDSLASVVKRKVIFDGRNLYDPATLKLAGWHYSSIGRGDNRSVLTHV